MQTVKFTERITEELQGRSNAKQKELH